MNYTQFTQGTKKIFLVDMSRELTRVFSELAHKGIQKYINQGKKILIFNNKRGWSTGVTCYDCGHIPQCSNCDVSISWHKDNHGDLFGLCHICKTQYSYTTVCTSCHSSNVALYGLGNQQLVNLMEEEFDLGDVTPHIIDAPHANSPNKIKKNIKLLELDTPQLIIGTSLITSGIQASSWKPDLVMILSADAGLHVPHYGARRNNFCFLSDIITSFSSDSFILQSYKSEHPSIMHACNGDTDAMTTSEQKVRKNGGYPPYEDMCALVFKHEIEKSLYTKTHKLYQELLYIRDQYEMHDLEIIATPPSIYKMYGKYRYHIILKGSDTRNFMDIAYSKLKIPTRGFKVDRNPQQI